MSDQDRRMTVFDIEPGQIPALMTELRTVNAFAEASDEELHWFLANCKQARGEVGDIVIREGEPAEHMFVSLEGEVRGRRESLGGASPVFTVGAKTVGGILPFSRMKTFGVTTRVTVPSRSLVFPSRLFGELIQRMPGVA